MIVFCIWIRYTVFMQRTIELETKSIGYTLRTSKRAKHVRLSVYQGGSLVVTAPAYVDLARIERFLIQKAEWVLGKIEKFKKLSAPKPSTFTRAHYLEHREMARVFIEGRAVFLNQTYGFTYKRISIKNTKTRWGSCSKRGNLNFNYRVALLPLHLADYVIVHELCHLHELNHSRKFWDIVAHTIPEHRTLKKELHTFSACS